MKRFFLLFFLLGFVTQDIFSQFKLDIEISGFKNNTGKVMLELYDSTEIVINRSISEIKNNECTVSFSDLKSGKYAVRYYHDENLNGKMETNMVGKPTEGYGFSNNVTGKFGPPPFDKWLFVISADKKISLKPTY